MEKFLIRLLTVNNDELSSFIISAVDREDAMKQVKQKVGLNAKFALVFNASYCFSCTKSDDVFLTEETNYTKANFKQAGENLGLSDKQTEACWLKNKGFSMYKISDILHIQKCSVVDRIKKSRLHLNVQHNREIMPVIFAEIKKIFRLQKKK